MISLYAAMLIVLGVLGAALLLLIFLPVYRRRVERLTVESVRRTLPLTEAEIRADKDNMRAGYAIDIHARDARLEAASLAVARQTIEINRREARIAELEARLSGKQLELSEHENAKRVLIQTITERLPKVEMRLAEARKNLFQRDREINELKAVKDRQVSALEEARQINVQQSAELARLKAAIDTRAARNRNAAGDPAFDIEVSLRSEIEELRGKIRTKDREIETLNDRVTVAERVEGRNSKLESQLESEIQVLRASLNDAQEALAASRSGDSGLSQGSRDLLRKLQEQEEQIALLKSEAHGGGLHARTEVQREERTQAKLRMARLEAEIATQLAAIEQLQSDRVVETERHAQQVAVLREEIRGLSEAAAMNASAGRTPEVEPRRSLRERINGPRLPRITEPPPADVARSQPVTPPPVAGQASFSAAEIAEVPPAPLRPLDFALSQTAAVPPANAAAELAREEDTPRPSRPRLLDRISAVRKPGP